jgi:hypothetical protein
MRYRLRTLLIVVLVVCVYLAWASHCRRKAVLHRQRSSQFSAQIAKRQGWTQEQAVKAISDAFENYPGLAAEAATVGPTLTNGFDPIGCSAIAHESTARKYDRAIWRPWVLLLD